MRKVKLLPTRNCEASYGPVGMLYYDMPYGKLVLWSLRSVVHNQVDMSLLTWQRAYSNVHSITLVLRGVATTPQQFSPWCSKSRSQGVKLLRVPSSSSFFFILAKKIRTYHLHRGRVSFQSWEVRGVDAIQWFLNWIILKIFEVICTPNFVCKLECPFSNIFCKNFHENRMFLRFFR